MGVVFAVARYIVATAKQGGCDDDDDDDLTSPRISETASRKEAM